MARPSLRFTIRGGLTRGLRFRLTLTYVLFFALLLTFIGIFFRQTLRSIYDQQHRELLAQDWNTVRAYLRIDDGKVNWFYDREDPDEAFSVERLRHVYLLMDPAGELIEISDKYKELGIDSPEQIQEVLTSFAPVWSLRWDDSGVPHLIRAGRLPDETHNSYYYVAIGRSLEERNEVAQEFTRNYFLIVPLMIVSSGLVGWFMAGRALRPVNDVARTAQRITGSNLTAQIPIRGVHDELDRLVEAFNRMIERLDTSFTQTRQFSTDVSHELRTPLTVIRGQLEVALMTAQTVDHYKDAIYSALLEVERLSQTIRALLMLAQAESGQVVLQKRVIDLSAVVTELVDQFRIVSEEAKVDLNVLLPPECPMEADRIQIERLVSNLLSNAIKYTPEGGSVFVTISSDVDRVEIIVEDTGAGISPDHLPHIFDRFYRVPSSDPERGLGLGLSFVAWIVKAHGGRIDVQSTVGVGTRFTVTLPNGLLQRVVPEPSPQESSPSAA